MESTSTLDGAVALCIANYGDKEGKQVSMGFCLVLEHFSTHTSEVLGQIKCIGNVDLNL